MENWQKQIKVTTVVLFVLTLVLFLLMWIPGVIHLSMYEGKFDTVYLNPIANDPYSALSGLITGLSLPVLLVCSVRHHTNAPPSPLSCWKWQQYLRF